MSKGLCAMSMTWKENKGRGKKGKTKEKVCSCIKIMTCLLISKPSSRPIPRILALLFHHVKRLRLRLRRIPKSPCLCTQSTRDGHQCAIMWVPHSQSLIEMQAHMDDDFAPQSKKQCSQSKCKTKLQPNYPYKNCPKFYEISRLCMQKKQKRRMILKNYQERPQYVMLKEKDHMVMNSIGVWVNTHMVLARWVWETQQVSSK